MAVRENEQLQVLQEFALGHVISDFFINRKVRSCELFKGRHNRKVTLSFGKPLVLERFELGLVEECHAAETRSLVKEVEVCVVLRVVFLLFAAGSLALSDRLLYCLRRCHGCHFLRGLYVISLLVLFHI